MELYIGTNFFTMHDSSMYIINPQTQDIYAMSTERLTRYKHDFIYPVNVLDTYLKSRNIDPLEVTKVFIGLPFQSNCTQKISSHYNKKEVLFRKIFKSTYFKDVQNARKQLKYGNFFKNYKTILSSGLAFSFLQNRLFKNLKIYKMVNGNDEIEKIMCKIFSNAKVHVKCFNHSYAHIMSSYYSSPFKEATLITMDGSGDGAFSQAYMYKNNKLQHLSTSKYSSKIRNVVGTAGSIGEIYSYFTTLLGFQALADEGKVEALAAYGNYDNEIYHSLMDLVDLDIKTHSLSLDETKAITFLKMTNIQPLIEKYKKEDVSAAVQKFLENVTIPYFKHIVELTGINNLCLSGGVAANVIMNLKAFEEITNNIHIIPAMGDEGTAEGVAIALMLENGYEPNDIGWIKEFTMPYFGSSYSNEEIFQTLSTSSSIDYKFIGSDWHSQIASLLKDGSIGALFQGRMEWGPRSLGNRSIIALANDNNTRIKMNKEIKKRPEFQPFCPSILIDEKERLFESSYNNKHMTCAFRMRDEFKNDLPSAVHVDGTARVQFVSKEDNQNYYLLLKEIKKLTGFGVLINTSFNKHGRTIVETPQDAIDDFIDTDLNFMMIGDYLVTRKQLS
ncbi:hypothetical protein N9X61_04180 [Sulfurimonas sp.]|nr:hypothetical protein [Sulfurimonas sp.]